MSICSDAWILEQCEQNEMIAPFERSLIREFNGHLCFSYGLGSYGYDIRLARTHFLVAQYTGGICDPYDNDLQFSDVPLIRTGHGEAFILDGNSFALGCSVERFNIPPDVIAIALGKSSHARRGLQVNITPLEPRWKGTLTIEIINNGRDDILVYPDHGIAQLLFFKGEPCLTTYGDRNGKYQNQPPMPVKSIL